MGGGQTQTLLTSTSTATATASATTNHHHHRLCQQPPTSRYVSSSTNFPTKNLDHLDGKQEITTGFCTENLFGFGPPPSQTEVRKAIFELKRVMNGFPATSSEIYLSDSEMTVKSLGQKRILDAYHMLQNDPCVQRMVISISSDRAVWNAILQNNAVQDLRGSLLLSAMGEKTTSYKNDENLTSFVVKWILGTTKSKIMELVENFVSLVNQVFQRAAANEKPVSALDDRLEEKVRSSVLLSVVVLLIVLVARSNGK